MRRHLIAAERVRIIPKLQLKECAFTKNREVPRMDTLKKEKNQRNLQNSGSKKGNSSVVLWPQRKALQCRALAMSPINRVREDIKT